MTKYSMLLAFVPALVATDVQEVWAAHAPFSSFSAMRPASARSMRRLNVCSVPPRGQLAWRELWISAPPRRASHLHKNKQVMNLLTPPFGRLMCRSCIQLLSCRQGTRPPPLRAQVLHPL
uniref:Putative secreted protein n=1 Tax=Amblyomma triste TaxID=251400 RepID=A0A023G1V1_AMBTT